MKKVVFLMALVISLSTNAQSISSIALKNQNGERVNLKEKTGEGLYVVSFWASWCVSCINELDEISDVYDEWKEETGVELIAVSIDDSRTKSRVLPMVNGKDWEYEILFDTNHDVKRAMNVSNVPYVFVIKDGKVVYSHSGYAPGQEDELFEILVEYSK